MKYHIDFKTKILSQFVILVSFCFSSNVIAQEDAAAPGRPPQITTSCINSEGITVTVFGSSSTTYLAPTTTISCAPPSSSYTGMGGWTGQLSWYIPPAAGIITYSFSQPIISATISYSSINGSTTAPDEGVLSINGSGTMSLSQLCGLNSSILSSQSSLLSCSFASGDFGDVSLVATSTMPFDVITLTHTNGATGWVQGNPCNFEATNCPLTFVLGSPLEDVTLVDDRQVQQTIFASNKIYPAGHAVYHANDFLAFTPGFEADFGSEFSAYIAECDTGFTYKPGSSGSNPTWDYGKTAEVKNYGSGISISPNPSSTSITVAYTSNLKSITIHSIDGKLVYRQAVSATLQEIDVSGFRQGLYLVTAEAQDGKVLTSKFVKN